MHRFSDAGHIHAAKSRLQIGNCILPDFVKLKSFFPQCFSLLLLYHYSSSAIFLL